MDNLETQKNLIHKIRELVGKTFDNQSGVSRLMRDKVEDYVILEEQPLPIKIGDKVLFVGNFTFETEIKFWKLWVQIMATLQAGKYNFDLLASGSDLYKALQLQKGLFKQLCKLIHKTLVKQQWYYYETGKEKVIQWKNVSVRWVMKYMTTEKLLQICKLVYIYNFDAEKKNLQILLGATGSQELAEMYMYSWLQNLTGLTGKFLEAQALDIDYVFADLEKKQDKQPPKAEEVKT